MCIPFFRSNKINPFHRGTAPQPPQPQMPSRIARVGTSAIQGQAVPVQKSIHDVAASINQKKTPLAEAGLSPAQLAAIAPLLQYVDCRGLDIDESFISLCTNATHLYIKSDKIKKLEKLPPRLETLDCSGSPALTAISLNSAPQLEWFACEKCPLLVTISITSAPLLEFLHCANCPALTAISLASIPKLRQLYCQNCTALPALALPDAPQLFKIMFSGCTKLTSFSMASAPQLKSLLSYKCSSLAALTLPDTPELYEISSSNCPALATLCIASAPQLMRLFVIGCTSLSTLPLSLGQCPDLYELSIDGTDINPIACRNIMNQCRRMRNGKTGDILPLRLEKWNAFAQSAKPLDISALTDDQKETLNEWLARLERTKDFALLQAQLADKVCNILTDVLKNKEFQELFFSQAEANNTCCQDRAAMSLNEIYTSWKILCTPETLPLSVMTGVAKTLRLRKELQQLIRDDERESVEIFLYYESTLRERLGLVTAIQNMAYGKIGCRDWIDIEKLVKDVEANFFEELIELPVFEKKMKQQWEGINLKFSNQLENLGECPIGNPHDPQVLNYQHRQGEIMQEWKKAKIRSAMLNIKGK